MGKTPVSQEETEEEGKVLFSNFLVKEICKERNKVENEQITPELLQKELHLCTPSDHKNQAWIQVGTELRRYADDFAKSKERKKVRNKANEILERQGSSPIAREQFRAMLSELLKGGITRHKIIVLFFFCVDVTIAAMYRTIELCRDLVQWSLEFIVEKVCSWVQNNGGWGAVFDSSMKFIGKAATVLIFGVLCYYGYKRFSQVAPVLD
ncbi:hypothetical protein DPMN_103798 [Dreissena polymorpha]|uniref:Bcl-2 Bcl-2 homology region 1-3 domain-containing protein n=2 Tax=Dreissena polymorpha TaxID=45954 RepID=A0A9D4K2S3_DREPO|nr:hypothetical protein DPMN_103798 [Dreissena polymorpha]